MINPNLIHIYKAHLVIKFPRIRQLVLAFPDGSHEKKGHLFS